MGSSGYSLNKKAKIHLELDVSLNSIYEWRGNPLTEKRIKEFIEQEAVDAVIEKLSDIVISDHESSDTYFDSFYFSIDWHGVDGYGYIQED